MKKHLKQLVTFSILLLMGVAFLNAAQPEVIENTVGLSRHTMSESAKYALAPVALKELAEKELIKHFRHKGTWLERIPNKNKWVGNDVIKLNEMGADPEVLINNNTYPIPVSSRTDGSTPIALFKYDTTNTKITDDELNALPYDKVGSVQQQHRETLEERTQEHALHSLAPVEDTAKTPVLKTTGIADANGRKRLTYADLVTFKKALDKLKIPKKGRILVLCADHVADLLVEDKALNVQYNNHKEGAVTKNYCGFELYEDIYAPKYNATTLTKIPFDSATEGVDASVLFLAQRTSKARGTVKRFMRLAENDPENRQTVVGFNLYFLVISTSLLGQGAIISG
ncbi:conserved exported hypothetical protein [Tenacibaculum maritimum]|uniref:hypothetical protein n=1 Tax=Tenacibaculum maritimum TaxID=107401 RepID=UPI0012E4992E|nr:hypothetical protein [Tenacibaculum maritimum]CAA0228865.1 conserved exported hypothetical protein [Tenacibaculum maritimum]